MGLLVSKPSCCIYVLLISLINYLKILLLPIDYTNLEMMSTKRNCLQCNSWEENAV